MIWFGRLKEMACDARKVLRHWWLRHWYGVVGLLFCIAVIAALAAIIAYSAKDARRKRIITSTIINKFEYVEFDGHEYLLWNGYGRGGITHSPKCRCAGQVKTE